MELSQELLTALNFRYNRERYASAVYMALGANLDANQWPGMALFMAKSSGEEMVHAAKFLQYIIDRNAAPKVDALPSPDAPDPTAEPPEVFAAALDLERQVSQEIINLYYEAHQARDFATVSFLEYFLDEQVKSERELTQIVADLDRADCPAALLMIDRELGAR